MEHRILFLGPVGAGKTTAVRTISDIDVVDTDVRASDEVRHVKEKTTVAMDLGVLELGGGDRIVLYGAPGQDRLDFMWDILLEQCDGALVVLNHSASDPVGDFLRYHQALMRMGKRRKPAVVGLTHTDLAPQRELSLYDDAVKAVRDRCGCSVCTPTFQPMDPRERKDVRAVLVTLAAVLEMHDRFGREACKA